MKKKILGITGALAIAGTLGVGMYQSDASQKAPTLNHDEVASLISAEYPGKITELELEKEDGRAVYEIEVKNEGIEYELKVDADSGEILKAEEERFGTNKGTKDNVEKNKSQAKSTKNTIIDANEAIEIALGEFSGEVDEVELDEDDGRLIYEVEIEKNDMEAEFEIDARTGEIIEMEIDD